MAGATFINDNLQSELFSWLLRGIGVECAVSHVIAWCSGRHKITSCKCCVRAHARYRFCRRAHGVTSLCEPAQFQNFKIPNSKNLYVEHIPIPTCVDLYGGSHTLFVHRQTHTHTHAPDPKRPICKPLQHARARKGSQAPGAP